MWASETIFAQMKPSIRCAQRQVPFRYRLLIGLSVPFLLWIFISAINVIGLNDAVKASERLQRGQEITRKAQEYVNAALSALAAKRGFIITSDPEFLKPFRRSANRINILHQELADLVSDGSLQQRRLQEAGDLIQEWLHDVARQQISERRDLPSRTIQQTYELEELVIALQDAHAHQDENGSPSPELLSAIKGKLEATVRTGAGDQHRARLERATMELMRYRAVSMLGDEDRATRALHRLLGLLLKTVRGILLADRSIRSAIGRNEGDRLLQNFHQLMIQFTDTEKQELERQRDEMMAAGSRVKLLVRVGPALGLVFMLFIIAWMAQRIGRSLESLSTAAGRLADGDMNARADVQGGDEFSVLATRFNTMAELIGDRTRESAALAELGELLQSCTSIGEATRVFASMAVKILPERAGVLYLVSASRDDVDAVSSWGQGEQYSRNTFSPEDCWALRLGRLHRNVEGETICCEHLFATKPDSICLPLHAFGETIGMLTVLAANHRGSDHQHLEFLETVAEQLGLALANLRLRESLRNQSIRDSLTGLYNRRYLEESFRRELHRASRHHAPLSVLTFDIDHFKRFNDTHGHDGGDAVLRAVGHCLQELFRAEDGAFRTGGEEFVAILADTSLEDAMARAEELRKQISRLKVNEENRVLPSISISVGVATYPIHGRTMDQLFKAADRALYQAKERGRNQVLAARVEKGSD